MRHGNRAKTGASSAVAGRTAQSTATRPTIDRVLAVARRGLDRLTPAEAAAEQAGGALLIDIRNQSQRRAGGTVPGAVAVDRTVLEWRCDPTSPWRMDWPIDHDTRMILICAEGYSSSLAAASLKRLGLRRATDVIGGFEAWMQAGLPVARVRRQARGNQERPKLAGEGGFEPPIS